MPPPPSEEEKSEKGGGGRVGETEKTRNIKPKILRKKNLTQTFYFHY